jgi:hypothetical protein
MVVLLAGALIYVHGSGSQLEASGRGLAQVASSKAYVQAMLQRLKPKE